MSSSISRIQIFAAVAAMNSISAASEHLGLNPSTVSRQLSHLEQELGYSLFRRNSRKLKITAAGKAALAHYKVVLDELEKVQNLGRTSSGNIRITAPELFGKAVLVPELKRFLEDHPDLQISLDCSDDVRNYIEHQFDVGISGSRIQTTSMVARPLGPLSLVVIIAPSLLQEFGPFDNTGQLERIPWVVLREDASPDSREVTFRNGHQLRPTSLPGRSIVVNDQHTLLTCVLNAMGVAVVERVAAHHYLVSGELVDIFPGMVPDLGHYWVYMPDARSKDHFAQLVFRHVYQACKRRLEAMAARYDAAGAFP